MHFPRLDPRICAACLAAVGVVFAGAVSGSAIGSTPVLTRDADLIPEAPRNAGVGEFELDTRKRLPDHYPLVTPTGTVPVAALAVHGRMRNSRGGWWDRPDHVPLDAGYPGDLDEVEVQRLADWNPPERPDRSSTVVRVHTPDEVRVADLGKEAPRRAQQPAKIASDRLDRTTGTPTASAETRSELASVPVR